MSSKLITVGNAADIRLPEYVDYLLGDPETRVIVAYVEGFAPSEGRDLCTLLRTHPAFNEAQPHHWQLGREKIDFGGLPPAALGPDTMKTAMLPDVLTANRVSGR